MALRYVYVAKWMCNAAELEMYDSLFTNIVYSWGLFQLLNVSEEHLCVCGYKAKRIQMSHNFKKKKKKQRIKEVKSECAKSIEMYSKHEPPGTHWILVR